MPLPEAPTEFTFADGLHQGDDAWIQAAGFATLENSLQDKDGAIIKQPGATPFTTTARIRSGFGSAIGGVVGSPGKLVKLNAQLGQVAQGLFFAKGDDWVLQGPISPWVADLRTVVEIDSTRNHDCCRSGNWIYTAFEFTDPAVGASRIRLAATYAPTGETLIVGPSIGSAAATKPRVVSWDNAGKVAVIYRVGADIVFQVFQQEQVIAAETVLGTAAAPNWAGFATDIWDVKSDPANARLYGAIASTANQVTMQHWSIGATTLTNLGAAPLVRANITAVAIDFDNASNRFLLVTATWTGAGPFQHLVSAQEVTLTFGAVWGETTLWQRANTTGALPVPLQNASVTRLGACAINTSGGPGPNWYATWADPNRAADGGEFATYDQPVQRGRSINAAGALGATTHFCGYVGMRSRPWFEGGRVYFLAEHDTGTAGPGAGGGQDPNSYYVVLGKEPDPSPTGLTNSRYFPFGFFAQKQTPLIPFTRMSTPFQDAAGHWRVQALETDLGAGAQLIRVREYSLVSDDRVGVSREFGAQAYIAGALLWAWDGLRVLEAGFLQDPVIVGPAVFVGGALAAGTRFYKATYSRVSQSGELIRSIPTAGLSYTNTGVQQNQVTLQPLTATAVGLFDTSPTYLEIWRTKAAQSTPFYLVSRQRLDPNSRAQVVVTDGVSDAALPATFGVTLYTDGAVGSELANNPPISAVHLTLWRNRLWVTDGEQVWYTKEGTVNRAAEFASGQVILRANPHALTALGALGDVLAVFGVDWTGFVYGEGPAANGDGSTLAGPIIVQGEEGCAQAAGLLEVPTGLIVPTRVGLKQLDLKRQYSYVGQPIERTFQAFPRLRDAAIELGADRAWFALSTANGSTGLFAVLDLQRNVWGTLFSAFVPVSMRSTSIEQVWLANNNIANVTGVGYLVNALGFYQQVETPWFKPGGLMGEIRVRKIWLLAKRFGAGLKSELKIEVGYDFADAYTHVATFSTAQLDAAEDAANTMRLRLSLARQRCTAFRLRLTETRPDPADETQGFRFVAVRFVTALRTGKGVRLSGANAGSGLA